MIKKCFYCRKALSVVQPATIPTVYPINITEYAWFPVLCSEACAIALQTIDMSDVQKHHPVKE